METGAQGVDSAPAPEMITCCRGLFMFTPTKQDKISTQIVRQIKGAIMDGKLKPGEALPQEKDLVTSFGVSKHTLREALRALEGLGLLTIRRGAGGGPVVSEIDWDTARDYFTSFLHFQDFTLADISEVRTLMEPYIARRATELMTDEDLAELVQVHKECVAAFKGKEEVIRSDMEVRFHVLMGKFTGNAVLWVILDFVNNILADAKHKLKPGEDFSARVIAAHERIIAAMTARDPDGAAAAMYDHIREVEEGLRLLEK